MKPADMNAAQAYVWMLAVLRGRENTATARAVIRKHQMIHAAAFPQDNDILRPIFQQNARLLRAVQATLDLPNPAGGAFR